MAKRKDTNAHQKAKYAAYPARLKDRKKKRANKRAEKQKISENTIILNCSNVLCKNKKKVKIHCYGKKKNIKENNNVHRECKDLDNYLCAECRGGSSLTPKKGRKTDEKRKYK